MQKCKGLDTPPIDRNTNSIPFIILAYHLILIDGRSNSDVEVVNMLKNK
jgi:hypothetical protein